MSYQDNLCGVKRYSEPPTFPLHELVLDRHLDAWGETLTLLRPSLARANVMIREHRTSCPLQSLPSAINVPTRKLVLHGTCFHMKFGMILSLYGVFSLLYLHDPLGFSNQRMKKTDSLVCMFLYVHSVKVK